ncbi:Structural maintenance of chromosomes protein 5 [Savitreella phatthalungensis]
MPSVARRAEQDASPAVKKRRVSQDSDEDGAALSHADFALGAITRIRMQNFMTYDDIEYLPGPALNMIIGPNGSGKSTVVAGICIGLGFDPKVMGRASTLNDTIKHGRQGARLDVELRTTTGTTCISRIYAHADGTPNSKPSNEWLIDGSRATARAVHELVSELRIQVDNLCQFLPQDKVASFARLTPIELLRETERTIRDGSLGEMHDELVKTQTAYNAGATQLANDEERLKVLRDRQSAAESEVARFHEIETLKRDLLVAEKRIPFAKYAGARQAHKQAKEDLKQAKDVLRELQRQDEPNKNRHSELVGLEEKSHKAASKCKRESEKDLDMCEQLAGPMRSAEDTVAEIQRKIEAEISSERRHKSRVADFKEKIAHDSQEVGVRPDHEVALLAIRDKLSELNAAVAADKESYQKLISELRTAESSRNGRQRDLDRKKASLLTMTDERSLRMEQLKQRSPDSFRAVEWLAENADKFEMPVYNPILLEVQVTDSRYAAAAQHVIIQNAFTFTCQTRRDYQTFNRFLVDGGAMKLRLYVAEYSHTAAPSLSDQRAPVSSEKLRENGLDGFLLDFLDGPAPVLNTLCHLTSIHSLPVGLQPLRQDQQDALEALQFNARPAFSRYIAGSVDTRIHRSYGQRSTASEIIRANGKIFSRASQEDNRKDELEQSIASIAKSLNDELPELHAKNDRRLSLKESIEQVERQKDELKKRREYLTSELNKYEVAKVRMETNRRRLEELLLQPAVYQDNIARFRGELTDLVRGYVGQMEELKGALTAAAMSREKHVIASTLAIQAEADRMAFDRYNKEAQSLIEAAGRRVEELSEARNVAHREGGKWLAACQQVQQELSDEIRELVEADLSATEEDLELQMDDLRGQIRLIDDIDGGVLTTYEARKRELEELEGQVTTTRDTLAESAGELEKQAASWTTGVEEMRELLDVSFQNAFRSINCVGEVRLGKAEDYAEWQLEIWVQFRNESSLQMLTGQRQSGGERSVSTIFFLLALQALARAPFRVVDEINQGMDPRNERIVHRRMVEVACGKGASQYFLITPKLLNDLDYHANMKVHCVTAGDLGQTTNKIGYTKYLAALRRIQERN